MKKLILFAAILFAGVSVVKADEPNIGGSGEVVFKLNLHTFQSIVVGGGDQGTIDSDNGLVEGAVVLDYSTVEKYQAGVSRTISDHIKIQSAGGYAVNVFSDVDFLSDNSGAGDVPISTIKLSAVANGDDDNAEITDALELSTTSTPFITSTSGSGNTVSFDVTYTGDKDNNYGKYVDATGKVRNLSATVTYQIVAQ